MKNKMTLNLLNC